MLAHQLWPSNNPSTWHQWVNSFSNRYKGKWWGRGHHKSLAEVTASPGLSPLYTVVQASLLSKPAQVTRNYTALLPVAHSVQELIQIRNNSGGVCLWRWGWEGRRWQAQEPCRPFIDAITSIIIPSAKDQYLEQKWVLVTFLNSERPRYCWWSAGTQPTPSKQKGRQEKPANHESSRVNYGPSPESIPVTKFFQQVLK